MVARNDTVSRALFDPSLIQQPNSSHESMASSFLGAPLIASFPIQPSRPLGDLFLDLLMQLLSIPMLIQTFRTLERFDDIVFFGGLCITRALSLFDTIMVLFIDNTGSNGLIYFSLIRSLVRHLAFAVAVGYISQRRLIRISKLVVRSRSALLSYIILGVCVMSVAVSTGVIVAFFLNGVRIKSVGDVFLATRPRATMAELQRATNLAVSAVPSMLWQVMHAVTLPLVQALHMGCDGFFYLVVTGLWTTTFVNVRRLTTASWLEMSWPYLTSLTLHFNFIVITIFARTLLRKSPLGFVVELGHFCTTADWFVFFTKTDPMVQDVEVTEVKIPNKRGGNSDGSNVSRSNVTVYTKQYRPPTAHLPGLLSPTSTGFPPECSPGSASAYGSSPPSTVLPRYASPSPPTSRSGTPANGSTSRKTIRSPSPAALAMSPIVTSRSPSRTPPLTSGQIHDARILTPQPAHDGRHQQQYMQHGSYSDPSPTVLDSARHRGFEHAQAQQQHANPYGSYLHPSPPHSRSASPSNHHQTDRRPSRDYIPALQIATMRLPSESGVSNGDQISNEPSWNPRDAAARASGSTYTAFAYSAAPATTSTMSGPAVSNPNGSISSSSAAPARQFLGRNPAAPTTSTARGQLNGPTHPHADAWVARSLSPSADPRSVGMSPPVSPRPDHEDTVDDRWRRARDEWAFTAAVEHQQREQQRVLEAYRERQVVQQQRYRSEVEIEVDQHQHHQQQAERYWR